MLNFALLKSPISWIKIWLMLAIGFGAVFMIAHLVTPASVESNKK